MFAYIGTFTGGFRGNAPAEGVYVIRLDEASGAMALVQTVGGLISPSFLARHPTKPLLYAVEREWTTEDTTSGAVSTLAIDGKSGTLALVDRKRSGGEFPAHVSAHPSGRYLFIANPRNAAATCMALDESGVPDRITAVVEVSGKGPHERQDKPWTHSAYSDPTGRRMVSCDLGIDRVLIYDFDPSSGALTPASQPYAQVSSGAGARHLAFGRDGRTLYVLNELDSTISVFAYDAESGRLIIRQTLPTLPGDFTEKSLTAEIVVSRSGRFVYASNRGHNSIARYAVHPENGKLSFLGWTSTQGTGPRNFNITPSGRLLVAANQRNNTLVSFSVNDETGELTPTGNVLEIPCPVCVVFS